jgi:NAD(P)-dependent dehydrogenase (short-subunit alcohol dehydrogenase family)
MSPQGMRVYDGLDWSISWKTEPQYARRVRHVMPLGKLQPTAQIARAMTFLCSDAADSMTGSVLLVDGGCSLFEFAEDEA